MELFKNMLRVQVLGHFVHVNTFKMFERPLKMFYLMCNHSLETVYYKL